MKIAMDARLIAYRRGIGNWIFNLLGAMADLPGEHSLLLYVDTAESVEFIPKFPGFTARILGPRNYPFWEQVSLPLSVADDGVDILHCPANTAPLCLPSKVKLILTVHDVMYLLPPRVLPHPFTLRQRLGRQYRRWVVPPSVRRAAAIITISQQTRQDLENHLGPMGDKLRVIYGAPNAACRRMTEPALLDAIRNRYDLTRPFVLALGAVDPRKNTARIVEAYARFSHGKNGLYQLALVGLSPSEQRPFRRLACKLGISDEVVMTGFIPEEDLVALYNASAVFAYPSLYEGFGLPVLEAMACGTPVIASPNGSLPEVAGEAAWQVDPRNIDQLAEAFRCILEDPATRERLIAKGHAQVQRFSWWKTAAQTLAVYESVESCDCCL
jgi:glycosyltransferase involved in cell wall biosynthesis